MMGKDGIPQLPPGTPEWTNLLVTSVSSIATLFLSGLRGFSQQHSPDSFDMLLSRFSLFRVRSFERGMPMFAHHIVQEVLPFLKHS